MKNEITINTESLEGWAMFYVNGKFITQVPNVLEVKKSCEDLIRRVAESLGVGIEESKE